MIENISKDTANNIKIEKIYDYEIDKVLNLCLDCFIDDHFYSEVYKDKNERKVQLTKSFKSAINYCVKNDGAYKVKKDKDIIAFVIYFDYFKLRKENEKFFGEIFGANMDDNDKILSIPYNDQIHKVVEGLAGNVQYILLIAVNAKYRGKKIGSSLIDYVIESNSNSYIVSDVSNKGSLKIYERRNFKIDKIDNDYFLIIHKPNLYN